MASEKAPFGTMHNQPKVSFRRQVDPAPWDKDASVVKKRSPVVPRRDALSSVRENAPKPSDGSRAQADRSKVIRRSSRDHVCEKPTAVSVKAGAPALDFKARGKVAPGSSSKNAPFGTAHNVPPAATSRRNVAGASRAPWEKDDSKQFQKIAFGNLKSFGAFIRT